MEIVSNYDDIFKPSTVQDAALMSQKTKKELKEGTQVAFDLDNVPPIPQKNRNGDTFVLGKLSGVDGEIVQCEN